MPGDRQVVEVLQEFARILLMDLPIQGILDHLVECIVDVLPITGAGIMLISPNRASGHVAASDASAVLFEELQRKIGEGPGFAACHTGRSVIVGDVRHDIRYPKFASHATALGLRAAFAFPLRMSGERLGALDLYRDTTGPLDAAAMRAAQALADVGALHVANARTHHDLREAGTN